MSDFLDPTQIMEYPWNYRYKNPFPVEISTNEKAIYDSQSHLIDQMKTQ